ncbi:MAG: threonine synthase [bacterium]
MLTALVRQECSECGRESTEPPPRTVSTCCRAPIVSRYDLARVRQAGASARAAGVRGVWRFRALLPLPDGAEPVTLGEGGTPLLRAKGLATWTGIPRLYVKDESANPTGSFKDRGLTVAVSLARAAGAPGIVLPTAGNAGAAAAAYGARAGLPVSVHAPEATPGEILAETRARGARLTLHAGTIADAGRAAAEEAQRTGFLSVATFKEPGRVEGKKTMAYELLDDLPRPPDAIVYPCGGGTGIVAMAQAFEEAAAVGWMAPPLPRLFAVQASGCAPIVRALREGKERASAWTDPSTFAAGLCVPSPFADRLILRALRATGGGALEVGEDEIVEAGRRAARLDGILPCPEGAAALAGAKRLREAGLIGEDESVVVFQTGSALKYLNAWGSRLGV